MFILNYLRNRSSKVTHLHINERLCQNSDVNTKKKKKNQTEEGEGGGEGDNKNQRKGKKKWYHNWTIVFKNSPSYPAVHLTLAVSNKKS